MTLAEPGKWLVEARFWQLVTIRALARGAIPRPEFNRVMLLA